MTSTSENYLSTVLLRELYLGAARARPPLKMNEVSIPEFECHRKQKIMS